jgi:hypothetical protein
VVVVVLGTDEVVIEEPLAAATEDEPDVLVLERLEDETMLKGGPYTDSSKGPPQDSVESPPHAM